MSITQQAAERMERALSAAERADSVINQDSRMAAGRAVVAVAWGFLALVSLAIAFADEANKEQK